MLGFYIYKLRGGSMKKFFSIIILFILIFILCIPVLSVKIKDPKLDINAKSAVLIDANTGTEI